jgi:DNA transposition AAA+ family ATPase
MRRQLPVHPSFQPLYTSQRFMTLFDYARELGRMVVIAGVPGVSKTASARQYSQDNNRAWLATIEASAGAVPMMLLEILRGMGEPEASGTNQKLTQRIVARIGDSKSVILIDESQHLTHQSIETARAINDRCRQLYPSTGVGIVLLGNEELYEKVGTTGGKRAFAQVSSRIAQRRYLIKPDPRDVAGLVQAWADANGEVITKDMLGFLQSIAAKHGGLRNVEMTFEGALLAARGDSQPLQIEHLAGAFAQASGQAHAA